MMNTRTKRVKAFLCLVLSLCLAGIIQAQDLESIALAKIDTLQALKDQAAADGLDVSKEDMTLVTARLFLKYANMDENNMSSVEAHYAAHPYYTEAEIAQYAAEQPDFQRQGVIDILDKQITEIRQILDDVYTRFPTPDIDWTAINNETDKLTFNGRPIFLADYVWKGNSDSLSMYYGAFDSEGLRAVYIQNEHGGHETSTYNRWETKPNEGIGSIWTDQNNVPNWAVTKWPDITVGHRHYGGFDVDHYGSYEMYRLLYENYVPQIADKKVTEMGYQLWNEPSFFTKANSWNNTDDNGVCVSDSTIKHFKIWLEEKHGSIATLNSIWGRAYASFEDVSVTLPMPGSLQGGPIWYDWMSFNNYRITRWFTFMKDQITTYDPDAKVHIKLMPWTWSQNCVDHGLDFEALTELSGLSGCDAGMQYEDHSWNADLSWQDRYSLMWRDALMTFDFFKSVKPNQFIIDTENHFLMNTGFNPRDLNQDYVRMAYWLGSIFGMSSKSTWVWIRDEDGVVRRSPQQSSSVDVTHQPKTLHTITSTYMDINTNAEDILEFQYLDKPIRVFFSITSAINDEVYMDKLFATYESVFFEGIPVGFATERIINRGDDMDIILVRENEWVTDAEFNALQRYLNNGGTVIVDLNSLKKDEYGATRSESLDAGSGKLILASTVTDMYTKAMQEIETEGLSPELEYVETNGNNNEPGCVWKYFKQNDGSYIFTVANLGNNRAQIEVTIPNAVNGTKAVNKFTGREVSHVFGLEPFEINYLRLTDERPSVLEREQEGIEVLNTLQLHPNPSAGEFILNMQPSVDTSVIEIFNLQGKKVLSKAVMNEDSIHMDISNCDKGIYLVRVSNAAGIQTIKYIKE